MKILNFFRRKKLYVVPYVFDEEDNYTYVLFFVAKTRKEVTRKVQDVATKYNLDFYVISNGITTLSSSTIVDENNNPYVIEYNRSSDIDFMFHFSREYKEESIEPYFMFTYMNDFINAVGFKKKNLDKLYKEYEAFFAQRGLFAEAIKCKELSNSLKPVQ